MWKSGNIYWCIWRRHLNWRHYEEEAIGYPWRFNLLPIPEKYCLDICFNAAPFAILFFWISLYKCCRLGMERLYSNVITGVEFFSNVLYSSDIVLHSYKEFSEVDSTLVRSFERTGDKWMLKCEPEAGTACSVKTLKGINPREKVGNGNLWAPFFPFGAGLTVDALTSRLSGKMNS